MNPTATIPAHVDPALVRDFDFYNVPGDKTDPNAAWTALQAGPRIFYTPRNGGHWVVTRGEDVATCLRDYTRFSSNPSSIPREFTPPIVPPLSIDPPDHRAYRNMLALTFSPRNVAKMEAEIRALTVELIEGFRARGECEFTGEFAFHMPIQVFMRLTNLPDTDRAMLLGLTEDRMRNADFQAGLAASMKLQSYIADIVQQRRAQPGDDLLSHIATATIERDGGRQLTMDELAPMGLLLLLAGLDTVASTLGLIASFLTRNPAYTQILLNDRTLIPGAIEELVRSHGVPNLARRVIADMEYQGIFMKGDDMVLVPVHLHGQDPEQFDTPAHIDFLRQKPHAGFGVGEHRCVGSHLARLELRIFLEEWLDRIGEFTLAPGKQPVYASGAVLSVLNLPLVWNR